ncbi:MAG: hypothetical protein JNK29_18525 [Anaerolineales bacterium]|nr:hypothetical protein [Anaerolineales bacterium]
MDFQKSLQNALDQIKDAAQGAMRTLDLAALADEPAGGPPAPVQRKVLVIIYNPRIPSAGGKTLREVMRWNDPDKLVPAHIADLKDLSDGYINYHVVERVEVDRVPAKADGFVYDPDAFVQTVRSGAGFHQPDLVDYHRILADFDIVNKVNSGAIDEVWLFAFPYGGFYESIMAGPGAFWCNAPVLEGVEGLQRRFVIMGYNYERGVGEMLENMGHRAESIMQHTFRHTTGDANLWEKFTRYDKTHPGQAEVGIVHYAPNSQKDYDWGNPTPVPSRADTWLHFPNLAGEARTMTCADWGNGEIRAHHVWWFRRFPRRTGRANGVEFNWWQYVVDPNTVR